MNTFSARIPGAAVTTIAILFCLGNFSIAVADDKAIQAIEADGLLERISALASDEFGGRAPMSEGERLTLNYLESQFREMA